MTTWMISCTWIMTRGSSNLKNGWLMRRDHHVSGPFNVPGAQPGGVLEIEIIEYVPNNSHTFPKLIS
jgi:acetamidase/formamidase